MTEVNIKLAKSLLMSIYADDRLEKICYLSKLRTYRHFETKYAKEDYLLMNLNRIERYVLTQLRCGASPLRIETERFAGEKTRSFCL